MRTESIGLIIAFSLCLAGCGQGPQGPKGEAGAAGPPGPSGPAGSAAANTLRVVRIECGTSACTAACNGDEVLVTAYCGPRRSAVTLVNERSASCPRGAGASPLVAVCAKITPQ